MQFLKKDKTSPLKKLRYTNQSERLKLKFGLLKSEQYGFCAYSERFVKNADSVHIDHFYPKTEENENDYFNLYAVLAWVNEHKPKKIEPYLPILFPYSDETTERIAYKNGLFSPAEEGDDEASNLINFLGLNKYEIYEDRRKHISRIRLLKSWKTEDEFTEYLKAHQEELSFPTALQHEFGLDAMAIIHQVRPEE